MVLCSLDCKEGHMKKNRLCPCLCQDQRSKIKKTFLMKISLSRFLCRMMVRWWARRGYAPSLGVKGTYFRSQKNISYENIKTSIFMSNYSSVMSEEGLCPLPGSKGQTSGVKKTVLIKVSKSRFSHGMEVRG
jgi:hypothetical protein